ncbi:MAG TPA: thioredoxin family protein [Terracidiphilus sp.]|nr:thioredoxin family protein [Terracidiphilus sp.]
MKIVRLLAIAATLALFSSAARPAAPDIYPQSSQARPDLAAALHTAAASHKRVILDFGGNWCPDCVVLDRYFHDAQNAPIVKANYVVVHVNVGHFDANTDLAQRYGIPLRKGVPALAVLESNGKLLYSQSSGQFEAMSRLESSALTQFLIKWKPTKPGCSVVNANC